MEAVKAFLILTQISKDTGVGITISSATLKQSQQRFLTITAQPGSFTRTQKGSGRCS
jgi:hypothetical protein